MKEYFHKNNERNVIEPLRSLSLIYRCSCHQTKHFNLQEPLNATCHGFFRFFCAVTRDLLTKAYTCVTGLVSKLASASKETSTDVVVLDVDQRRSDPRSPRRRTGRQRRRRHHQPDGIAEFADPRARAVRRFPSSIGSRSRRAVGGSRGVLHEHQPARRCHSNSSRASAGSPAAAAAAATTTTATATTSSRQWRGSRGADYVRQCTAARGAGETACCCFRYWHAKLRRTRQFDFASATGDAAADARIDDSRGRRSE
jgi:hypothetical protein